MYCKQEEWIILMIKKLKIWLIRASEALPIDKTGKLMRTGLLAEYLAEVGHEVLWWTSTYKHGEKKYRCNEQRVIDVNVHEKLILLHSPKAYKKNISFSRIKYYKKLAKEFSKNCETYAVPDIIICSYPTAEFAKVAECYGKKHNVPVILDVRDLWPDIFERAFPKGIRWLSVILLLPLKIQAGYVFRNAFGITGVTPAMVDWGVQYACREKNSYDRCIHIGCNRKLMSEKAYNEAFQYWLEKGIVKSTWNVCFIGTLSSNSLDLVTVIKAIKKLSFDYPEIRLIVCGAGDAENDLKEVAGKSKNIVFAGWLGEDKMRSLMRISSCGIYCYKNTVDFMGAFGNKIIQYMSEGLPIISSLHGYSESYIQQYDMGIFYEEGDIESCMEAIRTLYLEEGYRKKIGRNSLRRFEIDFEARIVNCHFMKLIEDVVQCGKYSEASL